MQSETEEERKRTSVNDGDGWITESMEPNRIMTGQWQWHKLLEKLLLLFHRSVNFCGAATNNV